MRRLHSVVVLVAAIVAQQGSSAQSPKSPGIHPSARPLTLAPGAPVRREISPGQSHSYRIHLDAGDFVRATIEQRGIDVVATLSGPDGRSILVVDASDDEFRPEVLVATLEEGGDYTIVIRPADPHAPSGHYAVRLDDRRPATPVDAIRIEAERRFAEGRTVRIRTRASTWPDALAAFSAALDQFRQLYDRAGEMKTLIEIAATQYLLSRPEALATARQAEQLARDLDDQPARARTLRLIGNTLVFQGDRPDAVHALEESATISHAIGHRSGESRSLNDLAIVCRRMGDVERAVTLYQRALPLARATNDRAIETNILNNLGVALKILGEYERARQMYEQSLANARAAHDRAAEVNALGNLVNLYRRLGRYDKSKQLGDDAIALAHARGDREIESHVLNNVADALEAMGEHELALERRREALAIAQETGDVSDQAYSLSGLAKSLHVVGHDDEAFATFSRALALFRQIRERFQERDLLADVAQFERDRGQLDDAARDAEASVDVDETLRAELTSPELRGSFVAAEHDKYELFIDILQRQDRASPGAGYDAAALRASERARARVLLDSLLDARVDLQAGISPALLERERSTQKQLNTAADQLSKLLAGPGREPQARAAADKVEQLTSAYQQIQTEIRLQSPRYADLTQPHPLEASEIQRDIVDADTVLLEFALGDEKSWLWAVTPDSITSVELPPRSRIEPAARSLYSAFTARQPRSGESAAAYQRRLAAADARLTRKTASFSQMLFGGIAGPLTGEWRGRRLAIVPSGVLDYLPFSALPEPQESGSVGRPAERGKRAKLLVASHEIVRIPSASVLAAIRRQTEGRRPAPHAVAILADPVFEHADPRFAGRTRAMPVKPASDSRSPLLEDHALGRATFTRLLFSREEASTIASLAPARDVFDATGFDANRDAALSAHLSDYRIVHFATHGVLDTERPSLSGLVLSLFDKGGTPRNGYVRLPDIYNMRLNADLVVLSACQTALGKEITGEGLISLTRAFMYAGVPRVVASLWEVNDLATAELMKRLYRGMLKDGLRPAAALRTAQVEMSQEPRWAAPYYWAGFVVEGDWK